MPLTSLQEKLIKQAQKTYDTVSPLNSKKSWEHSFTHEGDILILWFETADKSSHGLTADGFYGFAAMQGRKVA